jgi:predicted ribosomally synthesized peptide with SipW-like signal peptide
VVAAGKRRAGWRPLVAAAAMVAVLVSGTWMAWHDASTRTGSRQARRRRQSPPGPIDDRSEVQLAEQHYSTAIGDLEKVTQAESGSLDPDTAKVMQANLAVIDQAIGQSREALKSEPAIQVAQESLFDALRSKVQLLQDTVALINEMRKGNQEGAARIMSGMNHENDYRHPDDVHPRHPGGARRSAGRHPGAGRAHRLQRTDDCSRRARQPRGRPCRACSEGSAARAVTTAARNTPTSSKRPSASAAMAGSSS